MHNYYTKICKSRSDTYSENCSMLIVLAICGGNLFHNETVVGKNGPSYTLTRPNIGLKRILGFRANKNHESFSILQWIFFLAIFYILALLTFL